MSPGHLKVHMVFAENKPTYCISNLKDYIKITIKITFWSHSEFLSAWERLSRNCFFVYFFSQSSCGTKWCHFIHLRANLSQNENLNFTDLWYASFCTALNTVDWYTVFYFLVCFSLGWSLEQWQIALFSVRQKVNDQLISNFCEWHCQLFHSRLIMFHIFLYLILLGSR